MGRAARYRLVHLLFPRSRPGDAGRPGADRQPGRRPRGGHRLARAAAGARARRAALALPPHLHERVRRPREPDPRARHRGAAGLPSGQVPQRLVRQGIRRERAPVFQDSRRQRRRDRPRAGGRTGRAAHHRLCRGGCQPSAGPAGGADPLRQPLRRLSAAGCRAPGPGRAANTRRRDRAGGPVRQPTEAPGKRELMMTPPRRRPRMRISALKLVHLVPNMLTILGLCAGMSSIRYAVDGRWELAVSLIGAAVVLDGLDGRSARMLNMTSKLGAQLDSLADFLSFGVAPAVLAYLWTLHGVRGVGWALAMLFATCCALRLARFNTELETPDRPRWTQYFFTGIPAPAAAGLALTPMIMSFVVGSGWPRSWLLNAAFLVFVAGMMVSRVPTYSIKRIRIAPDQVLPTLLLASVIIVGLVVDPWLTLSLIGIVYLCSLPFAILSAQRMRKGEPAVRTEAGSDAGPTGERVVSLGQRPQRPS